MMGMRGVMLVVCEVFAFGGIARVIDRGSRLLGFGVMVWRGWDGLYIC